MQSRWKKRRVNSVSIWWRNYYFYLQLIAMVITLARGLRPSLRHTWSYCCTKISLVHQTYLYYGWSMTAQACLSVSSYALFFSTQWSSATIASLLSLSDTVNGWDHCASIHPDALCWHKHFIARPLIILHSPFGVRTFNIQPCIFLLWPRIVGNFFLHNTPRMTPFAHGN